MSSESGSSSLADALPVVVLTRSMCFVRRVRASSPLNVYAGRALLRNPVNARSEGVVMTHQGSLTMVFLDSVHNIKSVRVQNLEIY